MTEIVITGTGVPHLAPGRAGPGALVRHGDVLLQFDAGRATALRLCEAGVRMKDLTALFVTHHHSDHLTGLADLLFARWLETHEGFVPLPVIAPRGPSTRFLERMMDPWVDDLQVRAEHIGREAFRRDALRPFFAARPHLEHISEYHADSVELGALAERIGIPHLVLTHLIPAPMPGFATEQDFADDVRRGGYTGEVIVASDLTTLTLGR